MTSNYVVMASEPSEHAFVLHKISDVTDWYEIVEGESRAGDFPSDVTHTVSADYPHNMVLDDVFLSPNLVFLISGRLKDFLVARAVKQVEFLPVTILDHRKKPAGHYFILSPIGPIDCLDVVASKAKPSRADKDYVHAIDGIVVKPGMIDPELQILKIKKLFEKVIVRRDLAEAIDAQGFTGVRWVELADFKRS